MKLPRFSHLAFHRKVQLLLTATLVGSLLLVAVTLLLFQVTATRDLLTASLTSLARATAANCSAAVVFNDADDARETLSALAVSSSIRQARLTDRKGQLLAEFHSPGADPAGAPRDAAQVFSEPVLAKGEVVGQLTMEVDFSAELHRLTIRYSLVVLAVILCAAFMALTIARVLHRKFARPLQDLAQLADQLVDREDFSLRAPATEVQGEVATFTRAFNQMLDRVQTQDNALHEAQVKLSEQVGQLTHEVGERQRLEGERLELERKILAAQKLEGLGLLAGGIAHDFNNLLTPIMGNLSLMELDLPEHSPLAGTIRDSLDAARAAANLCRQMLAYAGRGQFALAPVDLNQVVVECRALLAHSVGKRIRFQLEPTTETCAIVADASQLQQIMMNLVINAAEAIGGGVDGRITLRTRRMTVDGATRLPNCAPADPAPGTYVVLEVEDNGPGMTEEVRRRIYEPFYTTKFTGRGLGLAAVMGIVRSHQGCLALESSPGHGTRFQVLLPMTTQQPAAQTPAAATKTAVFSGRVLVIDDEPMVLKIAVLGCERLGFKTLSAASGEAGLELFREHAASITAVLLDQTMPGLDGGSTFRLMNEIKPGVRVVLMSGHAEKEAQEKFPDLPLAAYLQKPFVFEALATALARAHGRNTDGSPRDSGL